MSVEDNSDIKQTVTSRLASYFTLHHDVRPNGRPDAVEIAFGNKKNGAAHAELMKRGVGIIFGDSAQAVGIHGKPASVEIIFAEDCNLDEIGNPEKFMALKELDEQILAL